MAAGRRGRPRIGEERKRRDEALDAAVDELAEKGYDATTMLGVARRAGASKETLYTWFGSKEGLFAAVIRREAATTNDNVARLLHGDHEPEEALLVLATNLLGLLTGPRSIAINRAAVSAPQLASVLLEHGRHRTGPLVEQYLQRLGARGVLDVPDAAEAFQTFYGLVIQDHQIRALLGEKPPPPKEQQRMAATAVKRFLLLWASSGSPPGSPASAQRRAGRTTGTPDAAVGD